MTGILSSRASISSGVAAKMFLPDLTHTLDQLQVSRRTNG